LNSTFFEQLEKIVNDFSEVEDFYKVRGQACYIVVAHFSDETLNNFIEKTSKYARYNVETVISDRKL
jgi:hypothetical protein